MIKIQKRNPIVVGLFLVLLMGAILAIPIFVLQPSPGALKFVIDNQDNIKHNVTVEMFDIDNNPLYHKSYFLESGNRTGFQGINEDLGTYRLQVTLDQEIKQNETVEIRHGTNLGGSDLVYIDIVNNTTNPIVFGIATP